MNHNQVREMYFPSQPEIQKNTNDYIELKPVGSWFNQDVALFYQFNTDMNSSTELSLIPDGCFDILFCCDSKQPSAFLWTSPLYRKKQPEFRKGCEYFGVRFFPEQTILKLHFPMAELLNKQVPLFDVMSGDQSIMERISEGSSFCNRMEVFDKFLQKASFEIGKDLQMVNYAIQQIYFSRGMLNVQDMSNSIGYSQQYIRRKFEEYIGFSPKQFSQVVKFQNCLDILLEKEKTDIFDIIYENGYYDQAHFIKGFKKLIRLTPKQYIEYFVN